ncbi:DISARM system phospholipase D-like protein DrmC [Glycomyces endophyticus]|uniref:DISARM system phospholipase D-like protein DrmC n=1 Tax=Glycomyces endophyticus TaxID=480996 RepID=UPI0031DCD433
MNGNEVRTAALRLLDLIGPTALAASAQEIAAGGEPAIIADRLGRPDAVESIAHLVHSCREWGADRAESYLIGLADGRTGDRESAELIWTGPSVHGVPVRATGPTLLAVVDASRHDLWLTTYSAKPHEPLLQAIRRAIGRGVAVAIAVETLAGAGSAISGSEPAHAFAGVDGLKLYGWPPAKRPADAKLHAKLALADATTLLVTSANLTGSGLGRNIEAGVLVKGGPAPQRAAEHLRALVGNGTLERIG